MSLKNAAGGVLLIAGTTIGAAVLALPVDTAHLGFNLSTLYFIACWLFMTLGALYVLEANLQVGYGTNLISMAKPTLGKAGVFLTWLMYLLLLYSLTAAYLTGAGAWMGELLNAFGLNPIANSIIPLGAFVVAVCVSALLVLGTHTIDLINRVLMIVLFAAFFAIFWMIMPHTESHLLFGQKAQLDLKSIPLIITSFGFAIIVPTLTEYLHGKDRQLKRVVLIGSLFPIVLYVMWEFVILGVIPQEGTPSLFGMQQTGNPAIALPEALSTILNNPWLTKCAQTFSIFALTTSILGVTLSLFDFLADGLKLQKNLHDKLVLSAITFIPPLVFVVLYPEGFSHVLRFAGIFVCVILGLMPALMVYVSRYINGNLEHKIVFGGKPVLILTMLFFAFVIIIEILHLCGFNLVI